MSKSCDSNKADSRTFFFSISEYLNFSVGNFGILFLGRMENPRYHQSLSDVWVIQVILLNVLRKILFRSCLCPTSKTLTASIKQTEFQQPDTKLVNSVVVGFNTSQFTSVASCCTKISVPLFVELVHPNLLHSCKSLNMRAV